MHTNRLAPLSAAALLAALLVTGCNRDTGSTAPGATSPPPAATTPVPTLPPASAASQ